MPVNWRQDEVVEAIRRGAVRGLYISGNVVRGEIVYRILQTPKTGITYRRRGVQHQASAPGEAPANDTGTLVRNITVSVDEQNLTVRINSGSAHGRALELGTPTIEPRPYLRVSLDAQRNNIAAIIGREIATELRGLGTR